MKTEEEKISKAASLMGKKGGRILVEKRGNAYMKKLSEKALKKRWGNK